METLLLTWQWQAVCRQLAPGRLLTDLEAPPCTWPERASRTASRHKASQRRQPRVEDGPLSSLDRESLREPALQPGSAAWPLPARPGGDGDFAVARRSDSAMSSRPSELFFPLFASPGGVALSPGERLLR